MFVETDSRTWVARTNSDPKPGKMKKVHILRPTDELMVGVI